MRECYRKGNTKHVTWRRAQLKGLLSFVEEKEVEIFRALNLDLGKNYVEAFRDEVWRISFFFLDVG